MIKQPVEKASSFQKIGAGSFAEVWVYHWRGNIALKVCKHSIRNEELVQEAATFRRIFDAIHPSEEPYTSVQPLSFLVPRFQELYPSLRHCLKDVLRVSPDKDLDHLLEQPAYGMRRVWPVPGKLREKMTEFFPESYRNLTREFIARIYFGKIVTKQVRFFTSDDLPLSQDRLKSLGFDLHNLSAAMGKANQQALGRIVFKAGFDAGDIEWVIGGVEEDPYNGVGLYIIDFNQCMEHNGDAAKVAKAMKSNDPYYPPPSDELFEPFIEAFVNESTKEQRGFATDIVAALRCNVAHT